MGYWKVIKASDKVIHKIVMKIAKKCRLKMQYIKCTTVDKGMLQSCTFRIFHLVKCMHFGVKESGTRKSDSLSMCQPHYSMKT